jgi:hypothetical protein
VESGRGGQAVDCPRVLVSVLVYDVAAGDE